MAAYMKDQFPFLGVASPERRTAQREALGDWRAPTEDELSDFARACWAKDEREFQYAACDTLIRHVKRIGPDALDLCEDLITDKPWWDTTDALASRVVAFHARRPVIERWLTSGNLWLGAHRDHPPAGLQAGDRRGLPLPRVPDPRRVDRVLPPQGHRLGPPPVRQGVT